MFIYFFDILLVGLLVPQKYVWLPCLYYSGFHGFLQFLQTWCDNTLK
jgi:hypothetical protein